ncbi:replication restart helicase PriA [Ruminococcus flavefaciens]|uniref:Replication restart protein PriA n=1 Tax=Ruminococcus flavefaciens TaxID=1265 RepID=A0A315Y0I2_RUMFL|nr:primosomal protein N' [Ruminococcus flavefaciens]PWJ12632.1 replication restart DNA helicase PriA [Ruminococcus flavefaciens]SSA49113.1 replication restart DNA helicase PriA [Ruminococcus flavefaciens]
MSLIAETAVSGTAYSFDMLFSYAVPDRLAADIACGCRVLVPFGRGNKRRIGVVMKLSQGEAKGLKSLVSLVDETPVVSEELLGLAFYLREQTFCTYFDAVKAMLPPAMSVSAKETFRLVKNFTDISSLSPQAAELLQVLSCTEGSKELNEAVEKHIIDNGRRLTDELCDAGALDSDNVFRQAVGDAAVRMVRLTDKYMSTPEDFDLTPKQKTVADFLAEFGAAAVREAAYMCGVTEAVVKRLCANGAAEEYEAEVLRRVEDFADEVRRPEDIVLSAEQQRARDAVYEQMATGKPAVFLLHGVTGSGKTSVFEKLIDDTVKSGRQAMLLIPEIGLTPQILKRFRSMFGERVAVIHSGLSLGQRLDEYKRIKRGDADIVIGTRSAVFAPLDNIGLIIIDEEGERSYKSDSSPRYTTHDIAKQRCAFHGASLLLASATPSIESYYLAERGAYRLLEMKERYRNAPLPEVSIVDMNLERGEGNRTEFSRRLAEELNANLQKGEQSILLLNRRGYHTIISCCDCYQPVYCPNCSVPLTYHKKNNKLMCHYCGYVSEPVTVCPSCGSERLKNMGFGTQKLEEELAMFFPKARVLRMDADTTFSRYSYEKNFTDFREGKYDIMIGTQMIGKGLDFPNVTLVGVLSVDKALYAGDFRSYERTFSLITQVVGRGGRGGSRGRAILQTFIPEHYIMNLAAAQDYKGFYNEEIAIRRAMIFPPLCDMCIFCFSGNEDITVRLGAEAVLRLMNGRLREIQPKTPVRVLGPVRCSYGRINGKYRYRIIMKCKNTAEMRGFISGILTESAKLKEMRNTSLYADMNGDVGV